MRLLFLIDAPQALQPKKDSTIALMRAAALRGDAVYYAELPHMLVTEGEVHVLARRVEMLPAAAGGSNGNGAGWMRVLAVEVLPAAAFDVVLMRKEPPVDEAFVMATRLLDIVHRHTPVANAPRALREQNEKLSILNFPELIPPTWVGADYAALMQFRHAHGSVVLKPLNGMGGQGVYVSAAEDKNFRTVFDMLSAGGAMVMAQTYLPAGQKEDLRVFVAGGAPLAWMLARLPQADDHRANMAAGGTPQARPLSAEAQAVAEAVAPHLLASGVLFAGLDVIDGRLIEINITCPTGLVEAGAQSGQDLATAALQAMCAASTAAAA